jgi:tetratricopeptide (TPR) repeat protein
MATEGQSERGPQTMTPATRKRLQKCFEHASKQTSQNNFDYATELLTQCVAGDPSNVLYVRSYIENLQKKYANNRKGAPLAQMKERGARSAIKKATSEQHWDEVIQNGLRVLAVNPWDITTLRAMATALQNMSPLAEVELYLLKCALEANPKEPETNRQCARAMADRGQYDQAIACWHRVEQLLPNNEEAQKAISDLAVRKTLSNLENKKAAMNRPASAPGQEEISHEEVLRRRIAANRKDLVSYYELAQIYLNANNFKEADNIFQQAFEASDGDPDVKEKWQDVQVRRLRHQATIARAKRKESDAAEQEYRRLRKELNERELEVCLYRVERYPNILRYKYDLGLRYQISKQYNEAIKQFQGARNDPRVKGLCLLGLAQCFQSIKQPRLAMSHYEMAISEIPDRDADNKKESLYQAGKMALEEVKDLNVAEKHLTVLAGMDFTYKDVSTLLDKIAQLRENGGESTT